MTIRVPIVFGRGIVAIGVTLFAMFVLAFWLNWSGHRVLFWVPVTIIAVPCVCGALLAVVMQFGIARVLMKCPFCRAYGEMTNGYQEGHARARPLLDCPKCGRVVLGPFGLPPPMIERKSVCPSCGYEYKRGETECPHCKRA